MQKNTPVMILGGIVVIVLLVWLLDGNETTYVAEESTETIVETVVVNDAVAEEESRASTTETATVPEVTTESEPAPVVAETPSAPTPVNPEPIVAAAGTFGAHSAAAEAAAHAAGDRVVLFFKASWCPSCRALEANINAHLSDIPSDVTILTVDFDTATDLKVKYGIVNRHTMVYIDSNGEQIKKWSGSPRLANLLSEI